MLYEELKDKILEAGIVGAGGAGFPTHVKMVPNMDYLVINGVECEPLLYADHEIIETEGEVLIDTIRTLLKTLHIQKAVIGIKDKHKALIEKLEGFLIPEDSIQVKPLESVYPSGDEVSLIYACTNRVIPKGQLPSSMKVIECNVETLLNIGKMLEKAVPVTHTYLTIGGAIKKKITVKAPVGMSVKELISLAGGATVSHYKVLLGGPMMGRFISETEYITKTTKGILIIPDNHFLVYKKQEAAMNSVKRAMSSCSQCRMCTDLCPRNKLGHKVEPHRLMNAFANGLLSHSDAVQTALGCCGCNLCSYFSCHHDLQPGELMMMTKKELLKNGIKPNPEDKVPMPPIQLSVSSKRLLERLGLKEYDEVAKLQELDIKPNKVNISLRQHIGVPAKACVVVGQKVAVGEKIGTVEKDKLGTNVHASIKGIITKVTDSEIVIERSI